MKWFSFSLTDWNLRIDMLCYEEQTKNKQNDEQFQKLHKNFILYITIISIIKSGCFQEF